MKRGRKRNCIEDSVDASIQRLEDYIQKHDGRLITAIRNDTDNTLDNRMTITRKLKNLWNMKVTIVPIVVSAFGTITKGLLKGLEDLEVGGRVETIQMTALLRTARILRRILETWEDLLSLKFQWKTIS